MFNLMQMELCEKYIFLFRFNWNRIRDYPIKLDWYLPGSNFPSVISWKLIVSDWQTELLYAYSCAQVEGS